jgi:hypothetical protein
MLNLAVHTVTTGLQKVNDGLLLAGHLQVDVHVTDRHASPLCRHNTGLVRTASCDTHGLAPRHDRWLIWLQQRNANNTAQALVTGACLLLSFTLRFKPARLPCQRTEFVQLALTQAGWRHNVTARLQQTDLCHYSHHWLVLVTSLGTSGAAGLKTPTLHRLVFHSFQKTYKAINVRTNVTSERVRVTIVAVEKQRVLHTLGVLMFSPTSGRNIHTVRRTDGDIIINMHGSSCTVPGILVTLYWILNFSDRFSKNTQISNFMSIHTVGTE